MPTRKQRRRQAKEKRHEYEFVYVDDEGNEVDDVPDELEPEPKRREPARNGAKPAAKGKPQQQRGGRPARTPQPPSWQRATRRALILGAIVFVLFSFSNKGANRYTAAIELTVIYTVLFIPFTYAIDRFAYRRWLARTEGRPRPERPAKKR